MSAKGIELLGDGDKIIPIQLAALDQHALAFAEVDGFFVEPLEPSVLMAVGEIEEQALHLDAAAVGEELLQAAGAEIGEALHEHVGLMKAFALGQFVEKLEDRAFGR